MSLWTKIGDLFSTDPTPTQVGGIVKGKIENATLDVLKLKPQASSCYGRPIPILYGTGRLPGNIIWFPLEYQALGGSFGNLMMGLGLALCEGPISGISRHWVNQGPATAIGLTSVGGGAYTTTFYGGTPLTLYLGARPQSTAYSYGAASNNKMVQITISIDPTLDGSGHCNYVLTPVQASPIAGATWQAFAGGFIFREYPFPGAMLNKVANPAAIAGPTDWCVSGAGPTYTLTFAGALANAQILIGYTLGNVPYGVKYGGLAYLVSDSADTGDTATQISAPNHSIETHGFLSGAGAGFATPLNPNPGDIINDLLTNTSYGCAFAYSVEVTNGNDGASASGFKAYCDAMGFNMAAALVDQKPALQHLKWLLDATNADCVFSGGTLKVLPLGDTAVGGYTPYLTAQYALTNDDFICGPGEEPIQVRRTSNQETFNSAPVEYTMADSTDAQALYATNVIDNPDQGSVEASGGELRKACVASLKCIQAFAHADVISQIMAKRSVYVRTAFTFKVGWKHCRLEPLDVVSLTEPVLGLSGQLVRIHSIEEDEQGVFTVEAEEVVIGSCHAVARDYVP